MRTSYSAGVFSALVIALLAAEPAAARQTAASTPPRDPAQAKAAAASQESPELRAAKAALAGGRIPDAIKKADAMLAARPDDRDASEVKISALLVVGDTGAALTAYSKFSTAAKREDLPLLQPIATVILRGFAEHGLPEVAAEADAALAKSGDPSARARVEAAAAARRSSAAMQQAERALTAAAVGARVHAIRTLSATGGPKVAAAVLQSLTSTDEALRFAAIEAAGVMKLRDALPALRVAAKDEDMRVRFAAAVALRKMGDATGDGELQTALASDIPGLRLAAARALKESGDKTWIGQVDPLLGHPDPALRVSAAGLLLGTASQDRATTVLKMAAADSNPAVRDEAVRALLSGSDVDLRVIVPLLTDASPDVRLLAAASVLNRKASTPVSK